MGMGRGCVCVYECTIFEGGKRFKPFFSFIYIYVYIEMFDGTIEVHCKLEIN